MSKITMIGLTGEEIVNGGLHAIYEPLEKSFDVFARQGSDKSLKWATGSIRFENPLESSIPEFEKYSIISYLNEEAKSLLEKSGTKLSVIRELDQFPENTSSAIGSPILIES